MRGVIAWSRTPMASMASESSAENKVSHPAGSGAFWRDWNFAMTDMN